jgi:Protein of unknown function (DUF 659)
VGHEHIVNVLASVGRRTLFLESFQTNGEAQTAENQADFVSHAMRRHGGIKNFAAFTTDNTESSLKMRRIISDRHPGIISLNDQAHVADLLIEDICKTPWCHGVLVRAIAVSNYVCSHSRLSALFKELKIRHNKNILSDRNTQSRTAVNFTKVCATMFAYSHDLLDRCTRNKRVLQDIVEDSEHLDNVVSAKTSDAKSKGEVLLRLSRAESFDETSWQCAMF